MQNNRQLTPRCLVEVQIISGIGKITCSRMICRGLCFLRNKITRSLLVRQWANLIGNSHKNKVRNQKVLVSTNRGWITRSKIRSSVLGSHTQVRAKTFHTGPILAEFNPQIHMLIKAKWSAKTTLRALWKIS